MNCFHLNQYTVGEAVKVKIPTENISILASDLSEQARLRLGKNYSSSN